MAIKFTEGYVRQEFNADGFLVSQEFVACGESEIESDEPLNVPEESLYHPFDMIQPE